MGTSFVRMLALVLLVLAVSAWPRVGWSQDSTEVLEEGRVLHHSTEHLFYFRIDRDSTVHIRQERPAASSSGTAIPAKTLAWIYRRVEEQLLSPEWAGEYLTVQYEDKYVILRSSQRFNLYALTVLVLFILVGSGILIWLWRRLARERRRREDLAQSRRYLAQGREKERERLAQEIHDGPVQDLHGLHMQMKALAAAPTGSQIEDMGDELMRVTGELRAMSADLHPPALQRFGLAAALRSHADRLRERHSDLQIDMDLPKECDPLPDDEALSVFRIAQEAMNNAVQHGQAGHVAVQFRYEDGTVDLTIQDDGDGFTPPDNWHALAEQDHYGLLGMRERAEAIDAVLEIDSTPGDGTCVRLHGSVEATASDERPESAAPVPA